LDNFKKKVMARLTAGLNGLSGLVGTVVIKQYANKTVVTSRPKMRRVKRTTKQKNNSTRFAAAVAWAKSIIADPAKKSAFAKTLKDGQDVYHAALRQYFVDNPR